MTSSPSRLPRARLYALWGALLSQGSPLGALALAFARDGRAPLDEITREPALYAYLSLATLIAFAAFGLIVGRLADRLLREGQALRDVNRRLRWLSNVDPLTAVLNRRATCRQLRVELKRARREHTTVALLMLDLDHFKAVNDERGHLAGDRVLRGVGRHLRRLARATDSVGRVGGEEFLVILPATGVEEAAGSAERLRAAIGTPPSDDSTPAVTASIGVAVLDPFAMDVADGLRAADAAMYEAKADGRNRVRIWSGSLRAAAAVAARARRAAARGPEAAAR